jgi:hypothetical protein
LNASIRGSAIAGARLACAGFGRPAPASSRGPAGCAVPTSAAASSAAFSRGVLRRTRAAIAATRAAAIEVPLAKPPPAVVAVPGATTSGFGASA